MSEQDQKRIIGLMDEPPINVYPSLAKHFNSVNKAIVLQQLHFLLGITKKAKSRYNQVDGEWWVYNTYKEWQDEHFPWLSVSTMKRLFTELEADGIIKSLQSVKHKSDRRKWYTINYVNLQNSITPPTDQNGLMVEQTKMVSCNGPKKSDGYTETTTETTTEKKDSADTKSSGGDIDASNDGTTTWTDSIHEDTLQDYIDGETTTEDCTMPNCSGKCEIDDVNDNTQCDTCKTEFIVQRNCAMADHSNGRDCEDCEFGDGCKIKGDGVYLHSRNDLDSTPPPTPHERLAALQARDMLTDEQAAVNSKRADMGGCFPVEESAIMATLDNMINPAISHGLKVSISFVVWNELVIRGWAKEYIPYGGDSELSLSPTPTGRAALEAYRAIGDIYGEYEPGKLADGVGTERKADVADCPVTERCEAQQVGDATGALCEVDVVKVKKPRKEKIPGYNNLFAAILDVCPKPPNGKLPKMTLGIIGRATKGLLELGAKPEEMKLLYYYVNKNVTDGKPFKLMALITWYPHFTNSIEYKQLQAHLATEQDTPEQPPTDDTITEISEADRAEAAALLEELTNR